MNLKMQTKKQVLRSSAKQPVLKELLSLSLTDTVATGSSSIQDTCGPSSCGRTQTSKWQSNAAPSKIDKKQLYKIPLLPINCSFGVVTEHDATDISLRRMVRKQRKAKNAEVTVMFAVRRPGCGNCKLHGQQLTEMLKEQKGAVNCVGVIKHINVDNNALLDFYENYFTCPIYKDEKWELYHALGNRKISMWTLIKNIVKMETIYAKKGVKNTPFGGDIQTQGGVLVFDKSGSLRYVQYENYTELLDMDALNAAIEEAKVPLHDEGGSCYSSTDIDFSSMVDTLPSHSSHSELTTDSKRSVTGMAIESSAPLDGEAWLEATQESMPTLTVKSSPLDGKAWLEATQESLPKDENQNSKHVEGSNADVWDKLEHQMYLNDRIKAAREKRSEVLNREKVPVVNRSTYFV
jgi:hypothetical protein